MSRSRISAAALWVVFTALAVYLLPIRTFHLHGSRLVESALVCSYVCFFAAGLLADTIDYLGRRSECQ